MYQVLVIQYVFILWWRLYCTFIIYSFKVHEIFTVEKNSGFFWLQKVVVFGLSRYLVRDPFSFSFIRNKFHLHIFFFLRSKFTLKKTKLYLQIPPSVSRAILFSQIHETNCEISLNVCTWILENSLRFKENTFSKNSQTISAFNWTQFFTISCSILVFLKVFSTVF